jgi:hypothetical protein
MYYNGVTKERELQMTKGIKREYRQMQIELIGMVLILTGLSALGL